jgi:hypothetical protein
VATVALVVLGACADKSPEAVDVSPPPSAGAATRSFCTGLDGRLPDALGELDRRATRVERVAAWGDPPIRLRCGVPPVERDPGDTQRIVIADVAWHARETSGQVVWTTLDLPVPVEVVVPSAHDGQLLAALSPALLGR